MNYQNEKCKKIYKNLINKQNDSKLFISLSELNNNLKRIKKFPYLENIKFNYERNLIIKKEEKLNYLYEKNNINIYKNQNEYSEEIKNNIDIKSFEKNYTCEFCGKGFHNSQALGGHKSRRHPFQSHKYNKRQIIREKRSDKREIIYNAKKLIIEKNNLDFNQLKITKLGKKMIKEIINKNKKEYLKIKGELKARKN